MGNYLASEGEFRHVIKVAHSHCVSCSKFGFTEIYSRVMNKILDNGIRNHHTAVGGAPQLESEHLGLCPISARYT